MQKARVPLRLGRLQFLQRKAQSALTADNKYIGLWINGVSEVAALMYISTEVPCFVVHKYKTGVVFQSATELHPQEFHNFVDGTDVHRLVYANPYEQKARSDFHALEATFLRTDGRALQARTLTTKNAARLASLYCHSLEPLALHVTPMMMTKANAPSALASVRRRAGAAPPSASTEDEGNISSEDVFSVEDDLSEDDLSEDDLSEDESSDVELSEGSSSEADSSGEDSPSPAPRASSASPPPPRILSLQGSPSPRSSLSPDQRDIPLELHTPTPPPLRSLSPIRVRVVPLGLHTPTPPPRPLPPRSSLSPDQRDIPLELHTPTPPPLRSLSPIRVVPPSARVVPLGLHTPTPPPRPLPPQSPPWPLRSLSPMRVLPPKHHVSPQRAPSALLRFSLEAQPPPPIPRALRTLSLLERLSDAPPVPKRALAEHLTDPPAALARRIGPRSASSMVPPRIGPSLAARLHPPSLLSRLQPGLQDRLSGSKRHREEEDSESPSKVKKNRGVKGGRVEQRKKRARTAAQAAAVANLAPSIAHAPSGSQCYPRASAPVAFGTQGGFRSQHARPPREAQPVASSSQVKIEDVEPDGEAKDWQDDEPMGPFFF
ncbi:hypothetical protein K438DRAFT_1994855 [Mycena galopus ATCC 62051]|nr:hypothetical protein K438DRAFT_1994855 [Mycena galopus ATCC 62051]